MSVNEKMTAIANAIRKKTGGTDNLNLDEMATAIDSLPRLEVITSAEQLIKLMGDSSKWGDNFILAKDISLAKYKNQSPIGNPDTPFTGSFDGMNHTISGINITADEFAGLFGYVENGVIQNLVTEGKVSKGTPAGGIVAASGGITMLNCVNRVDVDGGTRVAGIIGSCNIYGERTTYVENCINEGNITSSRRRAGGIAGRIYGTGKGYGSFINCKNIGNIVAGQDAGGFAGRIEIVTAAAFSKYTIEKIVNYGNIKTSFDNVDKVFAAEKKVSYIAGGLVGLFSANGNGTEIIFDSLYNRGNVTSEDKYAGGIFGIFRNYVDYVTTVNNAMNAGTVHTAKTVGGGIFGVASHGGHVFTTKNLYNCGSVTASGNADVGAITAQWGVTYDNPSAIENVYYLDLGEKYTNVHAATKVTKNNYSNRDSFDGIETTKKWVVTKIGLLLKAFYPVEEIVNDLEQAYENGYTEGKMAAKSEVTV
ncbi:MAG: hypothetical protein J6V06_05780 [Clostridia bacterium]|nr:hypothetical protein [Clostridia bacterium]